jgi:hypothetical protein
LWLLRGLFSDEILYSPAFSMAFGLLHGVAISIGAKTTSGPVAWRSNPAGTGGLRIGTSWYLQRNEPHLRVGVERTGKEFNA